MKREVPILLAAIVGLIQILDYFFEGQTIDSIAVELQNWVVVVSAFALALAAINLAINHTRKVSSKKPGAFDSALLLVAMIFTAGAGILSGVDSGSFKFVFNAIIDPAASAFYAMAAFHVASAAYRAFRAQNAYAAALLVTGVMFMIAKAPIGEAWFPWMPRVTDWIMSVLNLSGVRGIMISSAIGVICVSARILLGIDRSHLGLGKD